MPARLGQYCATSTVPHRDLSQQPRAHVHASNQIDHCTVPSGYSLEIRFKAGMEASTNVTVM